MTTASPPDMGIDPEILRRLGNVIVFWSSVEELLSQFLCWLLRADTGAIYAVTQNVSGSTVLDWIRTLCKVRIPDDEINERLTEIFNDVDDARSARNSLVHGLWTAGSDPGTATVNTVGLHRKEVMRTELVTIADLDELARDIDHVGRKLNAIKTFLGF